MSKILNSYYLISDCNDSLSTLNVISSSCSMVISFVRTSLFCLTRLELEPSSPVSRMYECSPSQTYEIQHTLEAFFCKTLSSAKLVPTTKACSLPSLFATTTGSVVAPKLPPKEVHSYVELSKPIPIPWLFQIVMVDWKSSPPGTNNQLYHKWSAYHSLGVHVEGDPSAACNAEEPRTCLTY
jgi:hypothetical protein